MHFQKSPISRFLIFQNEYLMSQKRYPKVSNYLNVGNLKLIISVVDSFLIAFLVTEIYAFKDKRRLSSLNNLFRSTEKLSQISQPSKISIFSFKTEMTSITLESSICDPHRGKKISPKISLFTKNRNV